MDTDKAPQDAISIYDRLKPLRTKAEVQASNEVVHVYVVEIPSKSTSALLKIVKTAIPSYDVTNLQHLRRLAKEEFLPPHLKLNTPTDIDTLHLLICPTAAITVAELQAAFTLAANLFEPLQSSIRTVTVPFHAPTSAAQAAEWTDKYWPIVYKNTNPHGPHPALIARAQKELAANGDAQVYMRLAEDVAAQAVEFDCGERIGAVVVERTSKAKNGTRVVAVAGDGRYTGMVNSSGHRAPGEKGNVLAHPVLRVIAMVAAKRRAEEESSVSGDDDSTSDMTDIAASTVLADMPLTPLEKIYSEQSDNLEPHGYLCLDLELYLTHEPCVMCSMAILHSRFGRVVFGQLMPKTGALSAEADSLGYGLFWRREQLNWKFLCWELKPSVPDDTPSPRAGTVDSDLQV
ncbi:cytidine deaminase-like protein [Microthyrium microscopicum]|uniref:Cytidine deaminase-like protein n=1 Tax=Microthyrium microscopicum TaxID=703497 RepID=A0A6A6UFF7_9PEZI|nr:cytidine deaminase-like protein [Microthyrium microscopicum]